MAPRAKRRRSNGARRRKALRDVSVNERWLQMWTTMDHLLYDITPEEEAQPRQSTRHKGLRINDLLDPQPHKMTHFYHGQLVRLYRLFNLDGFLRGIDETKVPLYSGHWIDNIPTRYLIDPKELFLFTLTKIATGSFYLDSV